MCRIGFCVLFWTTLGFVSALTIDNQLTLIKNDCYERLAIGHRLSAKDVYKKVDLIKTAKECQKACTQEKTKCRSLTFGIGKKGNTTCELSSEVIKETANLKPIGTIPSTEYDLYIKKMDCTIVEKPTTEISLSTHDNYVSSEATLKPAIGTNPDEIHHVQTLVAISPGLQKPVLHPVHNILIGNYEDSPFKPKPDELRPGLYDNYNKPYGSPIYPVDYPSKGTSTSDYLFGYSNKYKEPFSPGYYFSNVPDNMYNNKKQPQEYYHGGSSYHHYESNFFGYNDYNRPQAMHPENDYDNFKPDSNYQYRPAQYPQSNYDQFVNKFPSDYGYPKPMKPPIETPPKPSYGYDYPKPPVNYDEFGNKPFDLKKPNNQLYGNLPRPNPPNSNFDYNTRPTRPTTPTPTTTEEGRPIYPSDPPKNPSGYPSFRPDRPPSYDQTFPDNPIDDNNPNGYNIKPNIDRVDYKKKPSHPRNGSYDRNYVGLNDIRPGKPIITQSTGPHGQSITSIITEIKNTCFRRVLAGRRVSRGFVRKAIVCERIEDCQEECSEERRFVCEGFNYRLDPSGRGKGECELLEIPLTHLDFTRDTFLDPDYDYYERDRNAASSNCKGYGHYRPPYDQPHRPSFRPQGGYLPPPSHGSYLPPSRPIYPPRPPVSGGRPPPDYHSWRPNYDRGDYLPPGGNRRGDFHYHSQNSNHFDSHGYHYLPPKIPDNYEPYLPPNAINHNKDYWGLNKHQWDSYGGSYGTYGPNHKPPGQYLPPKNGGGVYGNGGQWNDLAPPKPSSGGLLPPKPHYIPSPLPAEPRFPSYNFLKDECSLRTATGFRLHKGIVKKFYSVPNIYECELLCFKERDFPCASYAFRYTISLSSPTDNCYLSDKNYKILDFYTDLQPDRDFDIYTMNNEKKCEQPIVLGKDNSECFWRVRSAQRLDQKIVRDSLTVKSIVDCQIECLRSTRFTCRAFSFRYGSPVIGGVIDNCQLTDWPFFELDPQIHFVPEPGFELYERGSFGHGCEPDHFVIKGKDHPNPADQLCYIGFGHPARLLPRAAGKILTVPTELECKTECSKLREGTLFQCMSFSYKTSGKVDNCILSDILQRDLLPNIDYVPDPDSWLFAWDNYNPECINLAENKPHDGSSNHIIDGETRRYHHDIIHPMDTWRVYSVSGWPCRRGSLCQENRESGFWFCELEGGDASTWDYCCRPDHQCGYSEGFQYQWCYVGPDRSQWRKCNDRYYPYLHHFTDRIDYRPLEPPPPNHQSHRPDRPPKPYVPPLRPSLDEYEQIFDQQFLDPPKPGGFGRHWPVSYLHKDSPGANQTETTAKAKKESSERNPRYEAIQNLINVIKSNDLKDIKYQITNDSSEKDDILFVKIPLPTFPTDNVTTNFPILEVVDLKNNTKRSQKSLPSSTIATDVGSLMEDSDNTKFRPVFRKGYIVRTNVTNYGRNS